MGVAELLKNLITKKYYEEKEIIVNKLNFFFALNQISEQDYSELMLQIEDTYRVIEVTEETVQEDNTDEDNMKEVNVEDGTNT